MTCSPSSLAEAAKCFGSCLSRRQMLSIQNYLLCAMARAGGMSANIVPDGATYDGAGSYTLTVLANSCYVILWSDNDVSMNLCGTIYTNPGSGLTTRIADTGACTSMVFTGLGGSTVRLQVRGCRPAPRPSFPIPTPPAGFTWTLSNDGTTINFSWTAPPVLAQVSYTEVWTSTDGVTYVLDQTVAVPATSGSVAAPAVGSTLYGKVRFVNADGPGSFSIPLSAPDAVTTGWIARVIANGGAAVANLTVGATDYFVRTIKPTTIWAKFKTLTLVPPDSRIAVRTPLIVGGGNDPWTVVGTDVGSLTVNGYLARVAGNSNDYNIGLNASVLFGAGDGGITVYAATNPASTHLNPDWIECGCYDGVNDYFMLVTNHQSTNKAEGYCNSAASNNDICFMSAPPAGYFSMNRTGLGGGLFNLYFANSTNPHAAQTASVNAHSQAQPNKTIYAFGCNENTVTNGASEKRISFLAVHSGLSAAESLALYTAIQAMRTIFGGGFV